MKKNKLKRINIRVFSPVSTLMVLLICFLILFTCCGKNKPETKLEIEDIYYNPYVPKSKFDSVKAAQTVLAQLSDKDSIQLLTEKTDEYEYDR
ncbi:hypothetical protein [Prevotella sp. 10(H)]|uniref:hypothetical protein n=1 Tax=Prevotella sp. 10(H) TaxID=1158294 RepID=UPI0004A6A985|nr:hypothetical protein [Prevotella sp. 10(H)]